jgi:hypothetical protein
MLKLAKAVFVTHVNFHYKCFVYFDTFHLTSLGHCLPLSTGGADTDELMNPLYIFNGKLKLLQFVRKLKNLTNTNLNSLQRDSWMTRIAISLHSSHQIGAGNRSLVGQLPHSVGIARRGDGDGVTEQRPQTRVIFNARMMVTAPVGCCSARRWLVG